MVTKNSHSYSPQVLRPKAQDLDLSDGLNEKEIYFFKEIDLKYFDDDNNQTEKYYNFRVLEKDSEFFEIEYGRIGRQSNKLVYPRKDLFKKFNEKIKKGYKVMSTRTFEGTGSLVYEFMKNHLNNGDDCWLPE